MLWTKRAHQSAIFQIFECSNESSPNSSCHVWNYKVRVYSNFASLFNVMKDNSSVFLWLKPCILWTKRAYRKEIFRLLNGWVKIHQIPHVIFDMRVSWEITLLYFFSWNFIWFKQKEPIKVQNFRLSTAHVKFHQIRTLIGSFGWKYIKFQLKKYRGFMPHDIEEWCRIGRKTDS